MAIFNSYVCLPRGNEITDFWSPTFNTARRAADEVSVLSFACTASCSSTAQAQVRGGDGCWDITKKHGENYQTNWTFMENDRNLNDNDMENMMKNNGYGLDIS